MADERAPFPTLQDASNVGQVLSKSTEGDAASGKVALTALTFKDSSGNLVHPQLDAEGKLPVTMDSAGTILRARGELAAGSLTIVDVTNAEITLVASKVYVNLNCIVSCRRGAYFQLVKLDDVTETVLADFVLDSGQYTATWTPTVDQVTAGATGTQKIKLKGYNFDKVSALRGSIIAKEVS